MPNRSIVDRHACVGNPLRQPQGRDSDCRCSAAPLSGAVRAGLLALLVAALVAAGPTPTARAADQPPVTDESVDDAIQRAVQWLIAQRSEEGHWERQNTPASRHWAGTSALAALSLLYADQDPHEQVLQQSLSWLSEQTLNGTYTYGVRAHALALVPGRTYRARLQDDLDWLLDAVWRPGTDGAGAYDYTPASKDAESGRWDNSCTQYGVLGVWMAADAGLSVPDSYWENVGRHWLRVQVSDGGWGYDANAGSSTGSMTAAGLASLFVVVDQLYADRPKDAGPYLTGIQRGLSWLGREYGPENPYGQGRWHYYYLYGVERVGRASGHKYFRDKDWFRGGAAYLLEKQKPEGFWPGSGENMGPLRNTALALMFLCHGRAPLLFNKLQHGPDWDDKLRDVAGLTRYAGHTFERLLNWQIVRLDGSMDDLMEAPVLYLYGRTMGEFSDVEAQKIRQYCQRGGLFLAVAGGDGVEFRRGFEALARRAFPEHPLRQLREDHPLFSGEVQFPIDEPPMMLEVHNGVRTLMLLCERNVADSWNRYATRGKRERDFHLACNVYLYATDKTTIRSRLQTPNIELLPTEIRRTIRVARVKYDGAWDVEPFGWTRLARYMNNTTGTRLLVTSEVRLDSEALLDFKIAYLAGPAGFELTEAEVQGLRKFLSGGGTLLADAAGGSRDFTAALERYVGAAQRSESRALPPDSFIYTGAGIPDAVDLSGIAYRRSARRAARGREYPRLKAFAARRRIPVIYSPLDLSAGLLGTPAYDVMGYEPVSALRIMRNLLLYADLASSDKARLQRGDD